MSTNDIVIVAVLFAVLFAVFAYELYWRKKR